MKIQAIISEYNPFHNGHLYQIAQAKKLQNADCTIALMGGNFLQRGVPAMWDKYTRAKMCVDSAVDLCLELPFVYATGSAHDFAFGAVSILNSLNCVDFLCFGAECSDIDKLSLIAKVLADENDIYKESLREMLAKGLSYPVAQAEAVLSFTNEKELYEIMKLPNNTLAIEYLAALYKTNSKIQPVLIERKNNYHEKNLESGISSATAIREALKNGTPLKHEVPETTLDIITETTNISSPIDENMLSPFIQSALIDKKYAPSICDMTMELCNRMAKQKENQSITELIGILKTKNITEARIRRSLLHMLLNYTQDDRQLFIENNYAFYANILGFKSEAGQLIKHIGKCSDIPLITKKADAGKLFENNKPDKLDCARLMWSFDIKATTLYNCLVKNSYQTTLLNDFEQTPYICPKK